MVALSPGSLPPFLKLTHMVVCVRSSLWTTGFSSGKFIDPSMTHSVAELSDKVSTEDTCNNEAMHPTGPYTCIVHPCSTRAWWQYCMLILYYVIIVPQCSSKSSHMQTHAFMHVSAYIHNVTVYILLISCSNYWWTMHKAIVSLQACRQRWIHIQCHVFIMWPCVGNELRALITLTYYCIIATVNVYSMLYTQCMLQSCTATLPTVDILQVQVGVW